MLNISNEKQGHERILRLPEVMLRTGLSRSSIYARIQENAFPKQINLGGRSSGWLESEISAWIASLVASSRGSIPKPT